MLLMLLAAQASAIDAERAFAADAKRLGQWTAFRKWAADDAVMFWPQPVKAQEQLKDLKDPPKPVEWQPARSFVSCDGTMAANTGPWRRPDGAIGYFSTIWVKQPGGGWKWTVDGGDEVKTPKFDWNAKPKVRQAACGGRPATAPVEFFTDFANSNGASKDGTLAWQWTVMKDGARHFRAALWNGREWDWVIDDRIAAPKP